MNNMNLTQGGGNNAQNDEQEDSNKVLEFLSEYRNQIVILVVAVLAYAGLTGGIGSYLSSIPRVYIDSLRYALVAVIVVWIFGDSLLDKVQDRNFHYLLELNLVTVDEPPRLFELGTKKYRNMSVEGRLYRTPILDVCVKYDKENNFAEGVWLAELSDIELLRFKSRLKEARDKMQGEMLEGVAKQESARGAAITAQLRLIEEIMESLAEKTSLEGSNLNEVIEDSVDDALLHDIADEVADENKETVEASEGVLDEDSDSIDEKLEQAKQVAKVNSGGDNE